MVLPHHADPRYHLSQHRMSGSTFTRSSITASLPKGGTIRKGLATRSDIGRQRVQRAKRFCMILHLYCHIYIIHIQALTYELYNIIYILYIYIYIRVLCIVIY